VRDDDDCRAVSVQFAQVGDADLIDEPLGPFQV
jgi:hypothetical protein